MRLVVASKHVYKDVIVLQKKIFKQKSVFFGYISNKMSKGPEKLTYIFCSEQILLLPGALCTAWCCTIRVPSVLNRPPLLNFSSRPTNTIVSIQYLPEMSKSPEKLT